MSVVIHSKNLEVRFLTPSSSPFSVRFDNTCAVEQVLLNDKHFFCVPEQTVPVRRTCNGIGLCGEFVWDELGDEAMTGQKFLKPGVGLLTQTEDSSPFRIYQSYEAEPCVVKTTQYPDRVIFEQEPILWQGIAMRIIREVAVNANTLTQSTMVQNVGKRIIDMEEYQHNFVAIDNIPMGPGYRLQIPFDGTIADIANRCFPQGGREPVPDAIHAEGDSIYWDRLIRGQEIYKITQEKDILPMGRYYWTLSHKMSPASITEVVSFPPSKMSLWSVEHCVCPELFIRIRLNPGEKTGWTRSWIFCDEKTALS